MSRFRLFVGLSLGCILMAGTGAVAYAQNSNSSTTTESKTMNAKAMKMPTLTATLVDPDKKAKEKAATVEVKVTGIEIIDPAKVNEKPHAGQGHFHYQLDGGPIIATTAPKLSFHELTPGDHKLVVTLAGNDHKPLGPEQTLDIKIP